MYALTEWLGSPSLPTAILAAALIWAVIRLVETVTETVVDVVARRSGWALSTDPEQLAQLERLVTLAEEAHDVRTDLLGHVEQLAGLVDEQRPAGVPAPRPAMGGQR